MFSGRHLPRKRLQTDYVDLLLIHFPGTNDAVQSPAANAKRRAETWRVLEEAKAAQQAPFEAKLRALGSTVNIRSWEALPS